MSSSEPDPPCENYIPLFRSRRNIRNRSDPGEHQAPPPDSTGASRPPLTKKPRTQSTEDILRELAQKAIDAMRVRGLAGKESPGAARDRSWDSRMGDSYDWFLTDETTMEDLGEQEQEHFETPQSPATFLRRVGFAKREPCKTKRPESKQITPPVRPPIQDAALPSKYTASPCTTPESNSPRRKRKPIGDVTPATAHAAECLLALTQ